VNGLPAETPAEQRGQLLELVLRIATEVLGDEIPEGIGPDQGFLDARLDSMSVVELLGRLERATGTDLPTTVAFDYPTPLALAGYIWAARNRGEASLPAAGAPSGTPRRSGDLSTASDEELFDFIDNDLGIS